MTSPQNKGFTVLELMTVLSIIVVLGTVAMVSYQNYIKKAHFREVVEAVGPYRKAVDICYQSTSNLNLCRGGLNGVPPNILNNSSSLLRHLIVSVNGRIYVFPNNQLGFTMLGDYLVMTPQAINSTLDWTYSGPALIKGYVSN